MNVSVSVMERGYGMQTCGTRVCVPYTNGTDDGMIVCLIELVLLVPFHLWCFFGGEGPCGPKEAMDGTKRESYYYGCCCCWLVCIVGYIMEDLKRFIFRPNRVGPDFPCTIIYKCDEVLGAS